MVTKLKVVGEPENLDASGDQVTPWRLVQCGKDAFYGSTAARVFDFQNNIFGYSTVTNSQNGELFVRGIIARCYKF